VLKHHPARRGRRLFPPFSPGAFVGLRRGGEAGAERCPEPFSPRSASFGSFGQGNRVKKSCGNETCEEVVVPGGDFAFGAEAWLAGSFADQIVGHVFEGGEVGGGVLGADAAFVVAEDHVHHPMEAVLDRPMAADDGADRVGQQHQ
jgi:hypothetical protein